jgi:hypothetical protein
MDTDLEVTVIVDGLIPYPRKVITRGQTTVVLWNDGTRTKSTCSIEDTFDPVIGFSRCLCKKLYPKKQFERIMKRVERQV